MKKTTTILLFCLLTFAALAQKTNAVTDKRLMGIDTALNKLLNDFKAAGFAVAIVEKNKLIYSNGFGYRDYENKKPATANTLFAIGSCTKAFTSSLLGLLEKDGKVSLDEKATQYLPELHFFNDNMNDHITLRDMMSHRTGLPRHDYSWYLFKSGSRDSLMRRIQYQEPTAGIREKWQYNNFMFLLQGMITEKITGKTWEQNVKEKIFTPLGMSRSNFSVTDLTKNEDASVGYGVKNDSVIEKLDYYNIDAMGPAGSINSSVNEMANWVIAWINSGKFNRKEILPSNYTSQAMSSQMVIAGALPDKENPDIHLSNYGLGWFLSSYRGHYRVEHGGNIDGFSASTCFFPSDSIGIIVLTNQNNSPVPSLARNIIADRMLNLKYINWRGNRLASIAKSKADQKKEQANATSVQIKGTKPSHPLTDYEGNFKHPGYGELEVFKRNDSLFGVAANDTIWLRHFHYDVFEIKGIDKKEGIDTSAGGQRLNFISNEVGKIKSVFTTMEQTLEPLEFVNTPKEKPLSKEDLEKYLGEYELPGAVVKVYLKGTTLFVLVPGQPDYETVSLGNHTFKLKVLDGYTVQFILNDKNVSTAMNFIQPNGIFKAEKKKK